MVEVDAVHVVHVETEVVEGATETPLEVVDALNVVRKATCQENVLTPAILVKATPSAINAGKWDIFRGNVRKEAKINASIVKERVIYLEIVPKRGKFLVLNATRMAICHVNALRVVEAAK